MPAIETATAGYLARTAQGKRWVFISDDSGFGRSGLANMTPPITAHGGQIVKSYPTPPATGDYSTILDELRALNPGVVAVINAGAKDDAGVSAVTKAGLPAVTTTALLYLSDVDRVKGGYAGVEAAVPWYWNLDAAARAWSDRFAAAHDGRRPTEAQAADYSATTQWLNAVRTAGTTDADAVVHALDGHRFNDFFAHDGEFRASDHAVVHDLYVVKVRTPAELREPQAWYDVLATVPAASAFPSGRNARWRSDRSEHKRGRRRWAVTFAARPLAKDKRASHFRGDRSEADEQSKILISSPAPFTIFHEIVFSRNRFQSREAPHLLPSLRMAKRASVVRAYQPHQKPGYSFLKKALGQKEGLGQGEQ